jgi:dihydrofolate reductase
MRKLVYDVAVTLDHYISHLDGRVDGFLFEGDHIAAYLQRLQGYDTVVMGRKTYEWGYPLGLTPGARPYPHMRTYVLSRTLHLPAGSAVDVVDRDEIATVQRLKEEDGSDIYLCGGGALAGTLLDAGLIDRLSLKVNPIVFGSGVPLFGASTRKVPLTLTGGHTYASGVVLLQYDLRY